MSILNKFRSLKRSIQNLKIKKTCEKVARELSAILSNHSNEIPCLIVSYNNGIYVENTVKQLEKYNIKPIILDNNSTDKKSLESLESLLNSDRAYVVFSDKNLGHMIGFMAPIYDTLPELFAYTDPDLQFSDKLPDDFLVQLAELTEQYKCYKAGFALDLLDGEKIIDFQSTIRPSKPPFINIPYSTRSYESRYWRKRLIHEKLEIYEASIDTTFAVYRKSNYFGVFFDAVRVAGDYTAIHLPWFPERDLFDSEALKNYLASNKSSHLDINKFK